MKRCKKKQKGFNRFFELFEEFAQEKHGQQDKDLKQVSQKDIYKKENNPTIQQSAFHFVYSLVVTNYL